MYKRYRTFLFLALGLVTIFMVVRIISYVQNSSHWGPFRGQIVDAETGRPIQGAVVLVIWWRVVPTPVHAIHKFYDAREAVSDAQGRFEVPRLPPPIVTLGVQDPTVEWFAPGYKHAELTVRPPDGEPLVDPTVIQMKRLGTRDERRKYILGRLPGGVPHGRMPKFIRALNRELSALGLGTYSVENGS